MFSSKEKHKVLAAQKGYLSLLILVFEKDGFDEMFYRTVNEKHVYGVLSAVVPG